MRKTIILTFLPLLILGVGNPVLAHDISAQGEDTTVTAFEEIDEPILAPDSPFYFFKQWGENVERFFAQSERDQAELEARFAERRVAEMKKLSKANREDLMEGLRERWQEHLEEAQGKVERLSEKKEETREKVLESTSKHLAVLERVFENAPEQAREGLQRAIDNAKQHQQKMLDRFSKDKHEKLKKHLKERFEKFREKHNLNVERFKEFHPDDSDKPK